MKLTRKEDISVHLYIKDVLLGPEYSGLAEEMFINSVGGDVWELEYDLGDICPFRRGEESGLGRGLIYFDHIGDSCCFGPEQTAMVTLYDGSTTLSGFSVNYLTGQVTTTLDLTNCNASYYWNRVAVVDSWPADEVPPLPVVAIDMQRATSLPLQLGYGDIRDAFWNVQIFASNKGERDDILDIVFDGINKRRCSVYEFEYGLPLLQNGMFNPNFNTMLSEGYTELYFERAEKRLTGLPSWGFYQTELINKYRAEITFETRSYRK